MNKKGFTTVELLLTMVLVVIIMATITDVTYVYRDRSNYEELLTEMTNYKNNVTKIIYDDILSAADRNARVTSMKRIDDNNYRLVTSTKEYPLVIHSQDYQVGITYDSVDYIVPGSEDGFVTIEDINYHEDTVNNLYSLEIVFRHRNLDELFKIKFAIT